MAAGLDIVGTVGVDVVPLVPNFHNKLKAAILPIADKVGQDAGQKMGESLATSLGTTLKSKLPAVVSSAINSAGSAAQKSATKQGSDTGGAFARSVKAKLDAAFKAMPKLDIKLSDTGVDAELARLRAKLEQLSNKRVGIDISAEDAEAKVKAIEEDLRRLGAAHPNVAVRADTATARAALAQLREEIAILTADPTKIRLETDGSFGARLRAAVEQAQASLPNVNIDANTDPAVAEIQSLRAQLAALSDQRVGIDIDAASALAKIEDIQRRLEILSIKRNDINVRADTAAAAAQLAALRAQADSVKLVRIEALADTSGARSALIGLTVQAAALVAIPLAPVLVAGLGAIAAAATAAGAGVGALALVAIPAFKGIGSALQAQKAAQDEATKSTDDGNRAGVQAQQRALQMAGAQQSLASAHRNAAKSIAQANQQVRQAERGVVTAKRGVEAAERAVADAAERAADARRRAADSVRQAEQSLSDAKRSARQAEEDLTQARRDAAQQLRDLNDELTNGALDQRAAVLRVKEAQQELQAVTRDPRASELQREQAQLAFDQAKQHLKEQKQDYAELQKSADAQRKAGVDGNEAVKSAAERLADAQREVQERTQGVADAQREAADAQRDAAQAQKDAAQQQKDAAQAVVAAQAKVADAARNVADVQVSAADSIASAERGVASARLSGLTSTKQSATAADAYRQALAKLTPEARDLFDAIAGPRGLKAGFSDWSKSLQPHVLPLFTRMVNGAKNSLPTFTPLVHAAARAVDTLQDKASAELKTPFWQRFKDDVRESAEPAIVGLGVAFGNVLKGMAGVVDAFMPHMKGIAATMGRITGRFAKWATGLKGSKDFENFLRYVKDTSPGLAEFIGDLLRTLLDLSKALAPLSEMMFDILGPMLDGLSWISEHAPGVIQILWGLYAVNKAIQLGMALFAGAMVLYEIAVAGATLVTAGWAAAIQSTGLVPVIRAIVLAVALLAAGVVYAYKNWAWFRTAVNAAWSGIKTAALFAWNSVLKPIFAGIWTAMQFVGRVAVWLWQNAIGPAFRGIWLVARILFTIVVVAVLTPIILILKLLGWVAMQIWKYMLEPAFSAIGEIAKWLWEKIIKPFIGLIVLQFLAMAKVGKWLWEEAIKPAFEGIGKVAKWLWENAIQPAFEGIADVASWLWKNALKPAFDKIKDALGPLGDAFGMAKDAVAAAWGKLKDITKKPVNFLIRTVYTDGIKKLWDKVAGWVGLGELPKAPKLLEAGGTVGDGWGTAAPMKVNRPTAIVGEGNPRYPEYVIPTDPKYRNRALALHQAAGTQLLESGGILGSIWGGVKDVGSGIVELGSKGLDKLGDILADGMAPFFRAGMKIIDGALDRMPGGNTGMGKLMRAVPWKVGNGIISFLRGKDEESSGGGSWLKPVNARMGTKYGVAGSMWASGHHTGVDFPASTGTLVRAVANGVVARTGSGGPYGNHVEIRHGGGLSSFYAHLSRILVRATKSVSAGKSIGRVGATGNTTGPHLHFEARRNGRPIDPTPFLSGGGSGFSAKAVGSAQQYAKSILSKYGWGPSQFGPLKKLWHGESGWRWNARNPSSGAFGIPQALPASKMASAGPDWRTNPATQIRWGLQYIKSRPDYGSPAAAYAKWLSRSPHWYDDGGFLPPGLSVVANGTGKPEPVFTSAQWDTLRANVGGGGPTEVHADVRVFVGDREITDIVRTEITARDSSTGAALTAGRRI